VGKPRWVQIRGGSRVGNGNRGYCTKHDNNGTTTDTEESSTPFWDRRGRYESRSLEVFRVG